MALLLLLLLVDGLWHRGAAGAAAAAALELLELDFRVVEARALEERVDAWVWRRGCGVLLLLRFGRSVRLLCVEFTAERVVVGVGRAHVVARAEWVSWRSVDLGVGSREGAGVAYEAGEGSGGCVFLGGRGYGLEGREGEVVSVRADTDGGCRDSVVVVVEVCHLPESQVFLGRGLEFGGLGCVVSCRYIA